MVVNAPLHRANTSPVKPGLPAANDNSIIQQRISNHCELVANVFFVTAQMRDKGIDPIAVYVSMLQSDLPDELKKAGEDIIGVVYGVLKDRPADEIAVLAYGTCMQHNTGVRRQA